MENIEILKGKIVVYKDGSYKFLSDGTTFEYENDKDYLTTISLGELLKVN